MRTYLAELLRSANRATAALVVLCLAAVTFTTLNSGAQHPDEPLIGFQQAAILIATLLMGRAAVVGAGDFSGGTIRPWLIAAPSRGPAFLGKMAASVTVALGFSVLVAIASYATNAVLGKGASFGALAAATGFLAITCAAFTLFGHAVGVLTRSIPVALTITLAWVLPAEHLLANYPAAVPWLPGMLLDGLNQGQLPPGGTTGSVLIHALLPFVVLEAVALVFFARRDVNS
ncbi:hypothetical protein FNH05_03460 [Amycolatopsis rhizosphaerae]|uniref:ABC transporter permease n=1 Tax=Amycolatopsis rhizosphaerae TaxID=2053003 RepID=A0A558DJF4_9PSEU|nr:hypothetical protein [Amycolatopsis rhizosphaerae]TVT61145.1 hypothetical protein FNH05_03460 [Amycolatopsis rhizosphaerae]